MSGAFRFVVRLLQPFRDRFRRPVLRRPTVGGEIDPRPSATSKLAIRRAAVRTLPSPARDNDAASCDSAASVRKTVDAFPRPTDLGYRFTVCENHYNCYHHHWIILIIYCRTVAIIHVFRARRRKPVTWEPNYLLRRIGGFVVSALAVSRRSNYPVTCRRRRRRVRDLINLFTTVRPDRD